LNTTFASAQKSVTEGLAGTANGLSTQMQDQVNKIDSNIQGLKR